MNRGRHVVVGVDGSSPSDDALRYACAEAALRHLPLTLVHAWQPYPVLVGAFWNPVPIPVAMDEPDLLGKGLLTDAAAMAAVIAPEVECHERLVQDRPVHALQEVSADASLVVVGGRDRDHHGTGWVGPVATTLAGTAHCPVVVVPSAPRVAGDVVVGVDGSEASFAAVAFAFEQAAAWGRPLLAVHAFPAGWAGVAPDTPWLARLHEGARLALSETMVGWSEKYPDVRVTELVSTQHPLRALRLAAEDAGLLVVGSHGRGRALRYLLGSVSSALLRVATCPTAVVRPAEA